MTAIIMDDVINKSLQLRDAKICLDCEVLFPEVLGNACPVCGGTGTWALTGWIPAMQGMDMVTRQQERPRQLSRSNWESIKKHVICGAV